MKKILAEFKEFINRGSVVDMAVGIMIGAAFKSIVDSLVNDIISPLIGLIAKENFANLSINVLGISLKYGSFLMAILNFFLVAAVLFMIVKLMNSLRNLSHRKEMEKAAAEEAEEVAKTKICPFCRTEIDIEATRCPHCTSQLSE